MGCGKNNGDKYKIFYYPFHVNTYGAVNEKRIEELACYIFEMSSRRFDRLYKEIKANHNGAVYGYLDIRVKIKRLSDGQEVYLAKDKTCASENRVYQIPSEIITDVVTEIIQNAKHLNPILINKDLPICNADWSDK